MSNLKAELLAICVQNNILHFGEFTLKSGRVSPYFFNAGLFNTGALLGQLATCYAALLSDKLKNDFMLYGPAYKGIPLVAATAIQLANRQQRNVAYAFNRKETKDHGEGGNLVGAALNGDVVIVDDVITAGTSIDESVKIIKSAGAKPCAIAIALDRQEIADGDTHSAVQKIERQYNVPVLSLLKLDDLVDYLQSTQAYRQYYDAVAAYRDAYGSR
ncbi:orotate phosphoribosyltransferase [Candidatus Spongiihabitans sp.]|uniref:orotate phosphoribosyltransferase n=1 Tax=Candidatus Spongiihabitans sp. TaxID=3101308 RepID=UPI003C79BE24